MQYQQVYQESTRGELRNVLNYQLKALTKGDFVLYFKNIVKGICVLYFGCFICVTVVVLELCIILKMKVMVLKMKRVLLIDPRQSLRKESMC